MTLNTMQTRSAGEASPDASSVSRGQSKLPRQPIRMVTFLTDGSKVEGFIHLPPCCRPLDLLNEPSAAFLAITDLQMSNREGQVEELAFLAVSKAQIVKMHEARARS